jgi:ATP-dependent helicase Lhr and Lhr-like helicase
MTPTPLHAWMASREWAPFPFQEATWSAWLKGDSGLLVAPTGQGKTLALWGGALLDGLAREARQARDARVGVLRYLWITPLRALARDTLAQLDAPVRALGLPWTLELRTGDTAAPKKRQQRQLPPTVLITTPESLSLLLSWPDAAQRMRNLRGVMVDEWHDLLGSKRGTQLELALARLRRWNPSLRVWGSSATLGNAPEALEVLCPGGHGRLVEGGHRPPPTLQTLLPPADRMARFPWAGHLGLTLLPEVVQALRELPATGSALVFTQTRAQAERWFQALGEALPEWAAAGFVGLHHGSLAPKIRKGVEDGMRRGTLRCVVATSTLELGIDLPAVDLVVQVGSPRGISRLLQRAGRSGHAPGARSHLLGVPTHAWEIVEFLAAERALLRGEVEPVRPPRAPLDVLTQHLVTVALGGGFRSASLLEEVRTTHAYRHLTDSRWQGVLDLVTRGGAALQAYPRYRRVVEDADGVFRVPDPIMARQHRLGIGTITDEQQMTVRMRKGGRLGTVEAAFLGRLRPGDGFFFGGRTLTLLEIRDQVAWVVPSRRRRSVETPRWTGGRLPLSTHLALTLREVLAEWDARGAGGRAELEAVDALLRVQQAWSRIPGPGFLLIEATRSREGDHRFLFPFLGRGVHEGLAALLAHRLARVGPRSIRFSVNDYGLELLSPDPFPEQVDWAGLLDPAGLVEDLTDAVNAAQLARQRFRDVARVSGLMVPSLPGARRTARQLQASSHLLFDVLTRWDPGHLLLAQARDEVLEGDLHLEAMREALHALAQEPIETVLTPRLTPLAFPLWADRMHAQVSTETWIDRVRRMLTQLERAAG